MRPKNIAYSKTDLGVERMMARYLARSCPKCNGYVGITIRVPGRNTPIQAENGHCLRCGYRMA